MRQFTSWSQDLRVTADGEGVVALAGAVGLRMLADRSGLTGGLSQVLTVRGFTPVHDRGRVLADVAVAIGCGGRDLVDVEALRTQRQVFGPVASDTTAGRALGEVGDRRRAALARARAAARALVWGQLPGGVPASGFAGGHHQPGMVVLRIDGTLVPVHSKKDKAAGAYKRSFGMHPLACWIDNTGELASLLLRGGGAGSNTADDLIGVLGEAIAQVPKAHRRALLVTCDAAGASPGLIDWLVRQTTPPTGVWSSLSGSTSTPMYAPRSPQCVPTAGPRRWTPPTAPPRQDADVTEITALMRDRLARTGWPRRLRVIVRRTRLAPGEQPTLFQLDGYKYSCFVTTTATLSLQLLDARHGAHARVEDQVRTTKDTGLGHLPSQSWQVNSGWCHAVAIAADLLAWFKLLGCHGELARAEPKTLRYRLLAVPARLTRGQRRRWLRLPRHKVASWRLHRRTTGNLADLAAEVNPALRGWLNYFTVFYPSAVNPIGKRIDRHLMRWARWKYKRLKPSDDRARTWLRGVRQRSPDLFVYWALRYTT